MKRYRVNVTMEYHVEVELEAEGAEQAKEVVESQFMFREGLDVGLDELAELDEARFSVTAADD